MNPSGCISRLRTGIPLLLLAFLSLSCGIGGSDFAGGGTGGTGISTGSITAFGSVVVNGVHFRTDNDVAPGFQTKKMVNGKNNSGRMDKDVFAVGMVVTVRHGTDDNNAWTIEYRNNLLGPVAAKVSGTDNLIEVLGLTVVVDDAAVFASLQQYDIVEVSGFVDNAGRIRAGYILPMDPPMPPPFQEFEVKGFVSALSGNTFRLGPLPDGRGASVAVSYGASAVSNLPGGPAIGMYVQVVTTDPVPDNGIIAATRVETLPPRTEFPDGAVVDLAGLVTTPWAGPGNALSFAVEGKRVVWEANKTVFVGGSPDDTRQSNRKVQVRGTETGGTLSAVRIIFPQ